MEDKNGKDKRFKKQTLKNEGKLLNKDGHNKKTKKERSTEERKYKEKNSPNILKNYKKKYPKIKYTKV